MYNQAQTADSHGNKLNVLALHLKAQIHNLKCSQWKQNKMIKNTADKAHAKKLQAIFRLLKNYKKEKYKML